MLGKKEAFNESSRGRKNIQGFDRNAAGRD